MPKTEAALKEIRELNDLVWDWHQGRLPRDLLTWERLIACRFAPEFELVDGRGQAQNRAHFLEALRGDHGQKRPRTEVESLRQVTASESLLVFRCVERVETGARRELTLVLREGFGPRGLSYVLIHEGPLRAAEAGE
jgi:hypothetical protein